MEERYELYFRDERGDPHIARQTDGSYFIFTDWYEMIEWASIVADYIHVGVMVWRVSTVRVP